jgi:hypothetical protein
MFYKEEDIVSELDCIICRKRLVDPRSLPCGVSCCHVCSIEFQNLQNKLKCPECKKHHFYKNKNRGFPFNIPLSKLLTKTPYDPKKRQMAANSPMIESIKNVLQSIESVSGKLQEFTNEPFVSQKREHQFESLRNEVIFTTDSLIGSLLEVKRLILEKLDSQRSNFLLVAEKCDTMKKSKIEPLINESRTFQMRSMMAITNPNLGEPKAEKWLKNAKNHLEMLQNELNEVNTNYIWKIKNFCPKMTETNSDNSNL